MHGMQRNLERYLAAERALNAFFSAFGYCLAHCVASAGGGGEEGAVGCCSLRHYRIHDLDHPAFERLRSERERCFGRPEEQPYPGRGRSPCEYHDPAAGCRLTTHKSPVCLAFLCPAAIQALRSQGGIFAYDYLGVYNALEWILTGDLPDGQYRRFREEIRQMTDTLRFENRRFAAHGRGGRAQAP
jgi:hypothetical protein